MLAPNSWLAHCVFFSIFVVVVFFFFSSSHHCFALLQEHKNNKCKVRARARKHQNHIAHLLSCICVQPSVFCSFLFLFLLYCMQFYVQVEFFVAIINIYMRRFYQPAKQRTNKQRLQPTDPL